MSEKIDKFLNVRRANEASPDKRFVYSAGCSFSGPIQGTKSFGRGSPPGCPSCGCVLYELESKNEWDKLVLSHALQKKDENYPKFIEWLGSKRPCTRMSNQDDFDKLRKEFDILPSIPKQLGVK